MSQELFKIYRLSLIAIFFITAFNVALVNEANAGFFTKLLREAGEAGGKVGKTGLSALDDASSLIRKLPDKPGTKIVAAHATPEGHWVFSNRNGEQYTAASRAELDRMHDSLFPGDQRANDRLEIHLSEETLFERRAMMKDLPANSNLYVVAGKDKTFAIGFPPESATSVIRAQIRPNVSLVISDRVMFREALWQLNRQLNAADVRVLSLQPDGPDRLPATPRFDKQKKTAVVDSVDPWKLETALAALRGQVAVVTGRIENNTLKFTPKNGGGERGILISTITASGKRHDVNVVVLNATATQPGGYNWFWQTVEVDGLNSAVRRQTFADFLNALGVGRGRFDVTAQKTSRDRIALKIVPDGSASQPIGDTVSKWVELVVSEVTGNVITQSVQVFANSKGYQEELDSRLFYWLPAIYHQLYLVSGVLGLFGLGIARRWWLSVWPPEEIEEYRGKIGYYSARFVRAMVFLLLFLPVIGVFACVATVAVTAYQFLMWPIRLVGGFLKPSQSS